ncbi:MAG: SH3 domain-containing protein [Planctomycetota bacterium]
MHRLNGWVRSGVVAAVVCAGAVAYTEPKGMDFVSGPVVEPVVKTGTAFIGKVTADRVNVRSGASPNHTILRIAGKGETVKVLDRKGEWLKIALPAESKLWISAKFVTIEGAGATVTGENVQVRAKGDLKGEAVCEVSKGTVLTVKEKKGDWVAVVPPEGAGGWIYAKYVKPLDEKDAAEVKGLRAVEEKFYAGEKVYREDVEGRKDIRDVRFNEMIQGYQDVSAKGDPALKEKADARIRELQVWADKLKPFQSIVDQKNDELERIRKEYADAMTRLAKPAPRTFLAEGWVEDLGMVIGRPGTNKLVKGGQTLFILKCGRVKLDNFVGKWVGVNGTIDTSRPGWEPVLDVSEIADLTQKPRKK